jgi:lantibiotic biosynthesis protein
VAKDRKRLFNPFSWVVARSPVLPVEAFLGLANADQSAGSFWHPEGNEPTPCTANAQMAMLVGAGHLVDAMQASGAAGDLGVEQKLLRYRIRMSTRPTPYGAFAGVALCEAGPATALIIDDALHRRSARPDMEWLLSFTAALEARDDVLCQLELRVHPCVFIQGGRVGLDDPTPLREGAQAVSMRASDFVLTALEVSRTQVRHVALVRALMERTGADEARSLALVRKLVDQGLLLTELRPPLTCSAPAGHVLERLQSLPRPPVEASGLLTALKALDEWVRLDATHAAAAWPGIDASFVELHDGPKTRVQVDLALGMKEATIGTPLLDFAADIAHLLFRLTPQPHGPPALLAYRSAFTARYGVDRRVPLLELLDARTGLGILGTQGNANVDPHRLARRHMALQALAQDAVADRRMEIELDDALLERLSLWEPQAEQLPVSIDLCIFVLAESPAAVNAGDFRIAIGPNLGSRQAGRYLGRFSELLGNRGHDALREAAEMEQRHASDAVWAESVYLPKRLRSANVAIRPNVRSHAIALGVPSGVDSDRTIPLGELTVGVRNDRLALFWRDREVRVRAGHMLTSFNAPHVSRFLEELGQDGIAQLSGFDWGPAFPATFLPRVTRGRAILAPAQWRLSRESTGKKSISMSEFSSRFAAFRERWRVPRYVYLVEGDNRLLLDTNAREQLDQLRIDLARRGELSSIVLQEALPGPEHAWVPSTSGHALVELVVPMARPAVRPQPARSVVVTPAPGMVLPSADPVLNRLRPPGTDWLFVKLYGGADGEEALLAGPVREFCDRQVRAARCASWFFIRYSDPQPHLRVRFRGDPNRMLAELLPEVCAWGSELMVAEQISHFSFDTYEREIERYGGPAGLAWAEAFFGVDSASTAEMLSMLSNRTSSDRLALLAVSVDQLLADLGLEDADRLGWYKRQVTSRHIGGEEYRECKTMLRAWFSPLQGGDSWPSWLRGLLQSRQRSVEGLRKRWIDLQKHAALTTSPDSILRSLVHMHCNRIVGADRGAEGKVLGMLLRLRESLLRAPPRCS